MTTDARALAYNIVHPHLLSDAKGAWAARTAIGCLVQRPPMGNGWGDHRAPSADNPDPLDAHIPIIWPNDPQDPPVDHRGKPRPWIDLSIVHIDTTQQEIGSTRNQYRVLGLLRANFNVPLKQFDITSLRYAETFAEIFRANKTIATNYPDTGPADGQIVFLPPIVASEGFDGEKRADGLSGLEVGAYYVTYVEVPFRVDSVS